MLKSQHEGANRIFLLAGQLSGRLKIDPEIGEFALVVLANVLNGVNMERHRKPLNWENNS